MIYVYILHSVGYPDRYYIGIARDLRSRLRKHNAREVSHTSKYAPWTIKTYIAFSNDTKAFVFERYLKSASGRAFAKKDFDKYKTLATKQSRPTFPSPQAGKNWFGAHHTRQ